MKIFLVITILIGLIAFWSGLPCLSQSSKPQAIEIQIEINATLEQVWQSLRRQSKNDQDVLYTKVIHSQGNRTLIEQKFKDLPVIGAVTCWFVQEEIPLRWISLKLVRSDKLKDMYAEWTLQSTDKRSTVLCFRSLIDTGLVCSQSIVNAVLEEKMSERLTRVKSDAEALSGKSSEIY